MLQRIRRSFFSKKVYLFDLDGTLYLGGRTISGALSLVDELRVRNKKIFFFTNNSSRSEKEYEKKLKKLGFKVGPQEIVMSTHSLMKFLRMKNFKRLYVLGTPAMKKMLSSSGFDLTSKPQVVVIGFDKTLTYAKLQMATRLIEAGVPYIVTHPDLFCPTDKGREPDCGAIAMLIKAVTDVSPLVTLGKPHGLMMQVAFDRCRAPKKDMILIGDRLSTDIQMARSAGIQSVLVLSGETTRRLLKSSAVKPTYVVGSVRDLLQS